MNIDKDGLLRNWIAGNLSGQAISPAIRRWGLTQELSEVGIDLLNDFADWIPQRRDQPPDLVAAVAAYGYARLLLLDWKLPVDIPESEYDTWRQAGYLMTMHEFQDSLASVAGGFNELVGREPPLFTQIIEKQVRAKLHQLDDLLSKSLTEYTPEDFSEEDLLDSDDVWERERFDEPFKLRQELECFAWGLEKLRILAISEYVPELRLPNKELYTNLMRIDLNDLSSSIQATDEPLRRILKHLASHDYYRLNVEYDPHRFWWRHQKRLREKRPSEPSSRLA